MKNFNFLSNLLQRVSAMSGMRAETINYDGQPAGNRRANMTSVLRHCKASDVRVAQEWCESGARVAQEWCESDVRVAREWLQKSSARVAQGLRKSVRFAATILVLLWIGVGNVWGETSTLTFTAACGGSGTADDDASWTVTSDGSESKYDGTKGIHYGTGKLAVQYITLSTSSISGTITKVVVNASTASGVSATTSVTVGGSAFGGDAQSLSTTATDYTFTGSASGAIIVTITKPSSATGALYCKSVTVTYSTTPAYTITATRNNDSYGTVEVTGTTITATPNSGYRVMSGTDGYTVTSGTATVVNNGDNTFTVTPSSDCTVRINFESKGCTDHYGTNVVSGASTAHEYGPIDPYYEYSTRQILYTKTDLGLAAGKKGTIKSISFQYAYSSALTGTNSVKIYMANTDLTELSTSKYVTSFTEVYSGAYNCSGNGVYNEIMLDEPFEYDGVGNLVVIIDDNSNKDEGYSPVFNYHTADPAPTYAQLYTRSASTNADPTAAATWTGATETNYRPNTKFCIQEADMTPATVTLMDNGATITEASAGAGVTLPTRTGCTGYTFAGWTKTWVAPQSSWTTTAPTIIPAGNYTPTANENLYPVYTKTESGGGPSNDYELYSGSITEGDYIIYYNGKAMNTTVTSDRLQYEEVTPDDDVITTTDESIIWHVAASGDYWTIYNANADAYAASTGAKNKAQMLADGTDDKSLWTVSGTSTYEFVNKKNKANSVNANLRNNGTYGFACYSTDTGGALSLYKNVSGGSTTSYISVPGCCTDPELAYGTGSVTKTYGASAFTNTLTNSHSVAVTYSSSDPTVATVNGSGEVTILKAGSTTITASSVAQTVSTVDYCADEASYTLTVNKADITPTLTYTPSSVAAGSSTSAPTVGGNPGSGGVTYAITSATPSGCATINTSTGVVSGVAVGSVTVTATVAATTNYNGGSATANVTITAASGYCISAFNSSNNGITSGFSNGGLGNEYTLSYTIPGKDGSSNWPQYWIGENEAWASFSADALFADMHFTHSDATLGLAEGATGKLHIWDDNKASGSNLWVKFEPDGYGFRWGGTGEWDQAANTKAFTVDPGNANTYWTEIVTLDGTNNTTWNYYVGLQSASGYVHSGVDNEGSDNRGVSRTRSVTTMKVSNGTAGSYKATNLNSEAAGTRGKFRIWDNNISDYNFVCHFVPYYRVTYNGSGASGSTAASADVCCEGNAAARTVVAAANGFTVPTGKNFGGWASSPENAAAGVVAYAAGANVVLTSSITLYAIWTDINYTVTVNQNPSVGATTTGETTTAHYNGTINLTTTVPSGYRFVNWTTSDGFSITNPTSATTASFTMPNKNVTVTANFQQTHTVTWKNNGENYGDPVVYDHGATLAFPASDPSAPSSCSEKVFVGWTSDPEITSETSTEPTLITAGGAVNTNATYRAVFADEEEGDPEPGTEHSWNENYTAWGGSTTHSWLRNNNAILPTFEYTPSPSYSIQSVELQYSQSNETGSNTIAVFVGDTQIGSTQNASGTNSNYTTYTFTNGTALSGKVRIVLTNTSANTTGQGTFYLYYIKLIEPGAPGVSYDNYITQCCSLKPVTGLAESGKTATSVTLSWTAPSPTTGIDHLELRNASTDAKIGSDIEVGTTTTSVSGLVECNTYSYKIVSVGAFCETPSDVVEATPFSGSKTVTFNYHKGTGSPASFTTSCGNPTTTLPTPTRENYRFEGWYTEASGGTRKGGGGDSYTPDATIELHAQWTRVYTVSYAYAGGSGSCAGGSFAEGEEVTTCATATKDGSTLTGWMRSDNSATVTKGNTFTMPASNVTLTAVWVDTPYTLTQNIGSHTTKGYTTATIKSGDLASSGLDLTYTISDNAYALPKAVTITGGGQTWTLGTNYTWSLSEDKHSATLHIEADLTISADVTVTVAEKARYTVIWDEHGSTTTEYYAADDNDVTMKSGIADCGEKKFYGWTEDAEFVSNTTTPPTMASSGAISGNKHYYAIYADAAVPANPGYNKVTTISAGTYIIASASKAYGGGDAAVDASPSDGVIASLPSGAKELTVTLGTGDNTGYFAISYDNSGTTTYIYGGDKSLSTTTTADYNWSLGTGTYAGEIISKYTKDSKIYYLQQNSSYFRCYTHTQTVAYMYKKQTTTYSNFAKTCAVYDIDIADTDDGTVTTTPSAGTGAAGEGQPITVNVTPNSCKYLSALKYNDGSDHAISIASTPYTFTMPASDVTVTATFADKSVSSIAANTATHRTLMQGTTFEGEQIRVTYNNGETEDLAWNASGLTFSGCNMSTLGEQTVNVAYVGSCGSANTSYSIEITDGIPVTFSDCGITTVNKYDPGDVVPVESTNGAYACAGWEFVGWSESSVAANSTSFTPVRNFNASTARTLYAVYANVGTDWISAFNTSELRGGATYVIVYRGYTYDYALLNTVASTNYLNGQQLATECSTRTEPGSPTKDRYVLEVTPTSAMKWQLVPNGDYYSLYNAATNKYLKITPDQHALLTFSCEDKFTIANGDNDSKLSLKSFNASASNYYLYWYNSNKYFEGWTTAQGLFLLTNVETFSSTPPCAPQAAIFHGNGGMVIASGGSPTGGDLTIREATRDAGITTPTAEYEDCDGKSWSFIGWADHEVDVTRVPVLTTDLLNDGGGNKAHAITTDGEEFWAVYTNQGEAMTQYGTISFSMSDIRLDYHTDETEVTKTVTEMGDYTFGYKRLGHQSNQGIQLEVGTGEFYNKTSLGRVNAISFNTFVVGGINNLKVYVGDAEKATTYELTAAELQTVGAVVTYYPTHDCEYVYIKNYNSYVCVEGISIEFGKGTKVWATTPNCKRVTLSGDIYATSTNGRGIMAVTPLHVNAYQLDASAGVVISSASPDVYFSTDRNANFAKAAASQPMSTVTVNAGSDGNLSTDIYVHYKPGSVGDGVPADVNVYANLAVPDPSVTATHSIHVRNMPEKFVVAAKVGATWYALPADMNAETNPSGVVIEVDETNMTATAPNTCSYTIWPVKTTNGEYDRYAINTAHYDGNAFGERVRFSAINNGNKGLWANNATSGNGIRNYAAITSTSDGGTTENTNPSYEWKITTTIVDGQWQYTLQTDQTQNDRYLRYWFAATGGPKWGTYTSGEQNLYFLPVTEVEPFEMQVVEWYPTKVLVQTEAALTSPSVKVNGEAVASPVLTNKGGKLWEISGLPLESNPTKSMTVAFTADEKNYACTKTVPIIISREAKTQASEPFATLEAAIYTKSDVVVRDGAVLTVEGSNAANTFNDVTIYPTSKISVPSDKKLTVHALTFFGGIDEIYDGSAYAINKYGVPELSLKGTLHKSIAQIDYVMRVDLSQMYSLALPYDVSLSSIKYWDGTAMTPGTNLYVSAYNGKARVDKTAGRTWVYETDFESQYGEAALKAGVGYTISAELQSGVGDTYSIIRMPMASNVTNDGTELAKTVPVKGWTAEGITDNHKGWNLVGNPYMVTISGSTAGGAENTILAVGHLVSNGASGLTWETEEYRYVTIPADDGTYYWQEKWTNVTLPPFKNFFLQVVEDGDLSFALASRQNMPARYLQAKEREVEFEVLLDNDAQQDHTGFLIADKYTPEYEINADLEKMEKAMSVYTILNGYQLAYNALNPNDAKEDIPVGFIANVAGSYTFSLAESGDVEDVEHIWLTDHEIGAGFTTDLIDDTYSFAVEQAGKNNTRFTIRIELKDEAEVPTAIENLGDGDNDRPVKFLYRDKMYILRNGVIYDATGKKVREINK